MIHDYHCFTKDFQLTNPVWTVSCLESRKDLQGLVFYKSSLEHDGFLSDHRILVFSQVTVLYSFILGGTVDSVDSAWIFKKVGPPRQQKPTVFRL